MRKVFVMAIAFFISATAFSQQPPSPEARLKPVMEKLTAELKLSTEQSEGMQKCLISFVESLDAFREKGAPPSKEEFEAITGKRNETLKKLLTESQFKKFQELEEEMRKGQR